MTGIAACWLSWADWKQTIAGNDVRNEEAANNYAWHLLHKSWVAYRELQIMKSLVMDLRYIGSIIVSKAHFKGLL